MRAQKPLDQLAGPVGAPGEGAAAPAPIRPESPAAAGREAVAMPSPVAVRRPAPAREPAAPRVQIGRIEVVVTAPAPPAPKAAPAAAPTPKPGALASRRYLKSL